MAAAPPGAQVSEDGHYWWDETGQQWQTVEDGPGASSSAPGAGGSSDPAQQGGTAQAEHIDVAGVCQSGDLTDDEIAQALADAGVSLADA
jgi:hypothetical protein